MTPYRDRFLEWLQAMGYTKQTVHNRKAALRDFIRWCDDRSLNHPNEITLPILERYRRHLYFARKTDGTPLSLRTQRSRLEPLKAWFRWLVKQHHLLYNPASELEMPRVPQRLPQHILTMDEIERILYQTSLQGEIGIRDRAIIETLYATGLRRMEIVNLKLYDIDLANGTLMVREGKGKKDRMVPIGERAGCWIDKYRSEVRPGFAVEPDDGTLFLTEYGEAMIKNRLSDQVKKYLGLAGIDKPGACHLFRHSMATHMLENGADIRFIQAMLGHANLSTTQIYTQVSIRKLKEIHAATHPAERTRRTDPDAVVDVDAVQSSDTG